MIPASRKGKGKSGSIAVPIGRDVLDALVPAVAGRAPDAPLLERWHYRRGTGLKWERGARGAWQSANLNKGAWPAIREKAGLPEVIPYALRHSSIVRGIARLALPLRLVAALHDTSTATIGALLEIH